MIFYCLAQYGLNVSLQISEGFEGMAFVFRRSPDTVFFTALHDLTTILSESILTVCWHILSL